MFSRELNNYKLSRLIIIQRLGSEYMYNYILALNSCMQLFFVRRGNDYFILVTINALYEELRNLYVCVCIKINNC